MQLRSLGNSRCFSKRLLKTTGVKPNVSIPTGSGLEKVNLMMAPGDMPDMYRHLRSTERQIDQMVKNNAIYPLEELIDKYCPEMKEEIPEAVWTYGHSQSTACFTVFPLSSCQTIRLRLRMM